MAAQALPQLPKDYVENSYEDAITVTPTEEGPNIFRIDLKQDWSIGIGTHLFSCQPQIILLNSQSSIPLND